MYRFVDVLYDWYIPRISHDISAFLFCSFTFQISLESSVSVLYFLFLKDFRWFAWHEIGLTDAVVNFISVILWRRYYICLVQNVITETFIV